MKNNNNFILLCGGYSTRIFEHIKVPKPMYQIHGQYIIENNLKLLSQNLIDLKNIYINIPKKHLYYFREIRSKYECNFIIEEELLGTAGSVKNIVEKYQIESSYILYGDQYYKNQLIERILKSRHLNHKIFAISEGDITKSGVIFFDETKSMIDFIEKPKHLNKNNLENFAINIGVYFFKDFNFYSKFDTFVGLDFGHDVFPKFKSINLKIKTEIFDSIYSPIFIDDIERIEKLNI